MNDFLLELRSEEIPARMQAKAKDDLSRLFTEEIAKAGLKSVSIETFATPRRLALIARGLPAETVSTSEERKGPRANAPEAALAGFLRSTGLTRDQLTERDGVLFAVIAKPGRPTADVLSDAIPAIIRAFPWPKSLRWGDASISTESLRWVRPLQGIVALFGEQIVDCEIDGIRSGAMTLGHRFHHTGPITIGSADDYVEKLRMCHVIVHHSERKKLIEDGAAKAAAAAGLTVIADEGLVLENAGLTEWPVPLLGRFDSAFLNVPREVIQLTMRTNQKYFACADADGQLANAFICTANIDAHDGGAAVVAGNEKVLSARLSDAKFFWEADLKFPLEEQAKKLSQVVFHEKLGTVADKVERVAKLARWLCEEGIVESDPDLAERAAKLCKADLVTGMVGEFPELQGVMGGHYAHAQGLPPEVADAIRDHYKPVGQGDDVPTAPVTVAVSLADKLDTLCAFFGELLKPTGSKDPFALRRSALAIVLQILKTDLRFSLRDVLFEARYFWLEQIGQKHFDTVMSDLRERHEAAFDSWAELQVVAEKEHPHLFDIMERSDSLSDQHRITEAQLESIAEAYVARFTHVEHQGSWLVISDLLDFFADRLKVQQREAGVRHDLIDAVFALGGEDDLVRLLARVKALQGFVGTDEGKNLLSGYKRAANILKKEAPNSPSPSGERVDSPAASGERGSASLASPYPFPGATRLSLSLSPEREGSKISLSYTPEPAETALIDALDSAEPLATAAIEREDFEGAMSALASLRAPIDAFFETVTVNEPDPAKRDARLALLARVRDAVHRVADFSKIDG